MAILVLAPILWGPAPEARAFVCGISCGSACAGAEGDGERAACESQCEAAAAADCNEDVLQNFALTVAAPEGFKPVDWDMKARSICRKYCDGPGCAKSSADQNPAATDEPGKKRLETYDRRTRTRLRVAKSCAVSCQAACVSKLKPPP